MTEPAAIPKFRRIRPNFPMNLKLHPSLAAAWLAHTLAAGADSLAITASNPLGAARANETIEISAASLAPLGEPDLTKIHIHDAKGAALLCQAVDVDGDPLRKPDIVIFQADFAPNETRAFTASKGAKQVFAKEQYKAFGRFNRERFDDFVWENDRIAHRTYGKALETWEGEPLSSSTIDIWSKRVPRMVVNDWYLADDYHVDHGEGADFYSAGPSRGCGGGGLWAAGKLWVSRNFVNSRVLANGPIRVMFELDYAPYEVNGVSVEETKRVTLDAGHQFDRYQLRYKPYIRPGQKVELFPTAGLKKAKGESVKADEGGGWLMKWEPVEKSAGMQGLAMIVPPAALEKRAEDSLNHLLVTRAADGRAATWWAGFCWDKAGHLTTPEAWETHVRQYAANLAAPIKVSVAR